LAIKPKILLLDEPLSNLDAQLRRSTRAELKRLQRQLGITTIYVTHDQEEALALSDRIAVLHAGILQQVGTPLEIYSAPKNFFVMNFIGASNALSGNVIARDGNTLSLANASWQIQRPVADASRFAVGASVQIAFRPEHVWVRRIKPSANDSAFVTPPTPPVIPPQGGNQSRVQQEFSPLEEGQGAVTDTIALPGTWRTAEFSGTHWLMHFAIADRACSARMTQAQAVQYLGDDFANMSPGEEIQVVIASNALAVFES
ncbi:ABC transporter ATP-binding protein, partial [candidate division KSB1 bacterium]|nr:ABC transporter ATP-binding protein [candidate division KSB1 bacterium]